MYIYNDNDVNIHIYIYCMELCGALHPYVV